MRFLDDRQKRTGWRWSRSSAVYLVYFVKMRLLTAGLPIEKKEWIYFAGMILILMLGTANVRMAAMREGTSGNAAVMREKEIPHLARAPEWSEDHTLEAILRAYGRRTLHSPLPCWERGRPRSAGM